MLSAFTLIASALAWLSAYHLENHNSWWAAMTVVLVAQPTTLHLVQKVSARLLGTIIGALMATAIFVSLSPSLALMLFALTTWVTFCVWLGAGFQLFTRYTCSVAGYTTAIILIPSILHPGINSVVAMERLYATLIGIGFALLPILFQIRQAKSQNLRQLKLPRPDIELNFKNWRESVQKVASLRAFVVLGLGSLLWILTGWYGAAFLMIASSVFAGLFSHHIMAVSITRMIFIGSFIGVVLGAIYRLSVLPGLENPLAILFVTWPILIFGAVLSRKTLTSKFALDLVMVFLLIAQPGNFHPSTFSLVFQSCFGVLLGVLLTSLVFQALPLPKSKPAA